LATESLQYVDTSSSGDSSAKFVPPHVHSEAGIAVCLAIPGQLVEFLPGNNDQLALVDVVGAKRKINIGLMEDVALEIGDYVLVHVGFAMSKVDEKEAAETLAMLELMGQAFTDELQAVAESRIE
jgi:hydrogenase expression/formation protein HypC